ncbi:ty3-gypsy retrotransposon protein [Cucumis melo var. makuwa]|uniref:Ty3-gypsy retrotransposon protein n=1 Tax=Cucumis melo var. makuwa TaxID=1194695 RepID=A0A5D3BM76_CUCMM|nr:ty3-gypsy retrotransposon protein [Cucumis melo var. makuwa]TYJ99821.1 ty3-gypsy retrotransposon protein [Cucumis melo var. makuwa]
MTSQGNISKVLSNISKRLNTCSRSRETQSYEDMPPFEEMIANSIKTQYGGPAQTFSLYSKPYTKRIDNLRMPNGYQPPKFQEFDGKGNPKQYVAHFSETCETSDTRVNLLVKKFVQTLKGNTFDWYTDLKSESIDSWQQLERDFLNHFYSSRHMLEQLLENQRIQLPECKRPKQVGKVDDLNYCKYHWVIGHPVEKCLMLKELIIKLARENKIELDIDDVRLHCLSKMSTNKLYSSLMFCSREDLHLHLLTCVTVGRIYIFIFSYVLKSGGFTSSSSNMCCS